MEVLQSPAELLTRSHLFPATPCTGFLLGWGEDLPFLRLYFYPAPRGFATPCLQKLKFKTSWGRLLGGAAAQIPTSPPGVSLSTIWQRRLPRRQRSSRAPRGLKAHGPAPAAAGFIPTAPGGAKGHPSPG